MKSRIKIHLTFEIHLVQACRNDFHQKRKLPPEPIFSSMPGDISIMVPHYFILTKVIFIKALFASTFMEKLPYLSPSNYQCSYLSLLR